MSGGDDRSAIGDVMVRYATAIDRRDWALFRTCFTEACVSDYGSIGRWNDAEELTSFMATVHAGMGHTLHRITNIVASPEGDAATCRAYVHVVLQIDGENPGTVYETFGFYDDVLVRTPAGWRISRRTFTTVAERAFS
jgi:3-phenylpropionate/cinnamic acid dioxygenase small subunit